jgi:hypothetical protein
MRRLCGKVSAMRRVHAIFVIVALLATPLALLARADCGETICDCMCSLVQKSLSSRDQHPAKTLCGQATSQKPTCTMNAKHHPPDYGLNTLMAPTAPLSFAALPSPNSARHAVDQHAQFFPLGFLSQPFQPPRR